MSTSIEVSERQAIISAEQYTSKLTELAQRWKTLHGNDLALRYETGALLNARFGAPGTRQLMGEGTLKAAAEQLQVAESDLSRMRSFAFLFTSFSEFGVKHPEVTTWTSLKELIAMVKAEAKANNKKPQKEVDQVERARKRSKVVRDRMEGQFEKLQTVLQNASPELLKDDKRYLKDKFAQFGKVVRTLLSPEESRDKSSENNLTLHNPVVDEVPSIDDDAPPVYGVAA
jgi:hypothetical protein